MSPDEDRTTAGAAAPNKNQAKKTNGTSPSASSTTSTPVNQNGSGSALQAATGSKSSSSQTSSQTSPRPSLSASCPNSPNHPAMSALTNSGDHIIYRLVLTGGPCSGKTTSQARLSTFFENLGWKVYRVPETATTLFSGGIRFPDLSKEEAEKFQENLIKVMIALERTFFTLAATCKQNCIVICDRGIMDAAAYMEKESWEKVLKSNGWNTVELRDNRYNQIIHMVTSADGAEEYYNVEDNPTRTEGLDLARQLDKKTIEAWVGHPYIDVIDNSTDFDTKIRRMIAALCRRIGIEPGDRLKKASRKAKFLVRGLPADSEFPPYQDFDVVHDYLITSNPKIQSRLRKRGQSGNWSYQHTVRRSDAGSQLVELRRQISHRDYVTMLAQRDDNHHTIYKIRRCFLWQQTYFQMDIYKVPCNQQCYGLILLDTYTTLSGDELNAKLPSFLTIVREVTNDSEYSMFNLSKRIGTRRFSSCYGTGTGGNVAMSSSSTMNGSSNDTIGASPSSAPPISNGLCPKNLKSNGNLPMDSNGIKTTNCNNNTSDQLNGTKQNGY